MLYKPLQEEVILNITIIIGWVVSFGLVTFGIFNGGQLDWFIDVPSLAITVGGTIGCLFASFPLSYLKNLPKYLKLALFPKKFNPQSYIEQIVEFAKIARTKGLISLEDSANKCEDPFLKESLMLIVDANDLDKVKSMLDDATDFMCERHERGRLFFEKGMSVFPAFGMLGTLVGLVNMLKGMGADSSNLSSGMAVALITTFYGSLFSADCIIAEKQSRAGASLYADNRGRRAVDCGRLKPQTYSGKARIHACTD